MLLRLLLPLLSVPRTLGHGYVSRWTVGTVTSLAQKQPLNQTAFRSCPENTGFIGSLFITSPSITCGSSVTPFNETLAPGGLVFSDPGQAAGMTMATNGGETIQLVISGNPGVGWPHDNGHIQTYLGLCGTGTTDCRAFDATKAAWFKIQSQIEGIRDALKPAYDASVDGNRFNITLPTSIQSGSYMLRFELIVFDQTSETEGFQTELYPFCGQLYIHGTSKVNLFKTIQFPNAYSGVLLSPQSVPGPGVLELPGGTLTSTGNPSPTSTGRSKSGSKVSTGLLIGAVALGVVAAVILLLGTYCFLRRRRIARESRPVESVITSIALGRPMSDITRLSSPGSPSEYRSDDGSPAYASSPTDYATYPSPTSSAVGHAGWFPQTPPEQANRTSLPVMQLMEEK